MSTQIISSSTRQQRLDTNTDKFKCLSRCHLGGNGALIHENDAEEVYADCIEEMRWFQMITKDYCGGR